MLNAFGLEISAIPPGPRLSWHPGVYPEMSKYNAYFNAEGEGVDPLHYTWYADGEFVGGDSPSLTLAPWGELSATNIHLVVSNAWGAITYDF